MNSKWNAANMKTIQKKIRTATILKSPFSYLNLPFQNGLGIGERKFHPISQIFQYLWTCPSCKIVHGLVVPKRAETEASVDAVQSTTYTPEGELEYPIAWMCSAIVCRTVGSAGISHLTDGAMALRMSWTSIRASNIASYKLKRIYFPGLFEKVLCTSETMISHHYYSLVFQYTTEPHL